MPGAGTAGLKGLIGGNALMTLRTNAESLMIRPIFGRENMRWSDFDVGKQQRKRFNVYTGLFCYYSDRVDVVSSRRLLGIPLVLPGGGETVLTMNAEEVALFFSEGGRGISLISGLRSGKGKETIPHKSGRVHAGRRWGQFSGRIVARHLDGPDGLFFI